MNKDELIKKLEAGKVWNIFVKTRDVSFQIQTSEALHGLRNSKSKKVKATFSSEATLFIG